MYEYVAWKLQKYKSYRPIALTIFKIYIFKYYIIRILIFK